MQFVQKAAERGFKYAWADTCCTNKESSAELSEAVNSMFKVCVTQHLLFNVSSKFNWRF